MKSAHIPLPQEGLEQLWKYHQLLRRYNPELNLTRIHNFANMVVKLYIDSILPGKLVDLPSPLLDLGTGPGMPGVPLKIAFPHLTVLLAESRQKRVEFLKTVVEELKLEGTEVIGEGISTRFERSVAGVITRAVEDMGATLERVGGCLSRGGLVVFMKGPHCDNEIQAALEHWHGEYQLLRDLPYRLPGTPHERRLVVFQRLGEPLAARKARSMALHTSKDIASLENPLFKEMKKLLTSRGIRKQNKALVSGSKQVSEILARFPERCEAWITSGEADLPPSESPRHLAWYRLAPQLFRMLDVFGTERPLLLIRVDPISPWDPALGLPSGCSLMIPFQDPENVGAVMRSAAAFGVHQVILLAESAHPYHPKALRASGGTALRVKMMAGPSLDELPEDLPVIPLSAEGKAVSEMEFPETFAFLPGMEGPGLPERFRRRAVSIPINEGVESLNAATATAIALYLWSQSVVAGAEKRGMKSGKE